MKLKLNKLGRKYLKLSKHVVKRVYRKAVFQNALSRLIRKYAKMEAGQALHRILGASGRALLRRPRVKLAAASILTLVLLMVISAKSASVLKSKENDIKINGKAVLVAQKWPEVNTDQVEIVATISPRISPFDYEYPVENGRITQKFSGRHRAYDIATAVGSKIRPIGTGIVEFAGRVTDGKGNVVIIDHGDGLKTSYAHMGKIEVGAGNMVNGSSVLGTVGMTGRTTGPHVHLEVYDHGVAINPSSVLPD